MEVLQVVAGPLAAGLLAQHLVVLAVLAAAMDLGEIQEEEARASQQRRHRAVVVGGQRIDAGFDVGEVPSQEIGHVGVEAPAVRHGRIGAGARPRAFAGAAPRRLRQPAHREAMADVPSDARQLAGAVGGAERKAGNGIGHA